MGKQIEARIHAEVKLDGLVELRIRTGENLSGDPGVWVWAIVKDEFTRPNDRYKAEAETIRRVIRKASLDVAPDVTPYIAFRSVSEIAQTKREKDEQDFTRLRPYSQ